MLLHNYLELFRQAVENLEDYGYTESIEIEEEIWPNKVSFRLPRWKRGGKPVANKL